MSEDVLDSKYKAFLKSGWNPNGSLMLAMASLLAQKNNVKVKKKFARTDIFFICVLTSLAIKFLNTVPLLIIMTLSLSYSVRKYFSHMNLNDVLNNIDAKTQKTLVLRLLDYCITNRIESDNQNDLLSSLRDNDLENKILNEIKIFVDTETIYTII